MRNRWTYLSLSLMSAVFLTGQSCVSVTYLPGDGHSGGGSNRITVRFVNRTTRAVEVQFFATGQPSPNLETDLFVPAHQVTAGIGFAGSGVLDRFGSDEIQLSCAEATTLATLGGRFLDANTGAFLGNGRQLVLYDGAQFECGDTITFTFSESNGVFTTGLAVE